MTIDTPLPVTPSDFDPSGDQELLRRIQDGDISAWESFYTRYFSLIYSYIRFRVSTHEEAEDLTGDVFTKACSALPKFKWTGVPLSGWLLRIAHNRVIDDYRKKNRFSFFQLFPWSAAKNEKKYEQIELLDVINRALHTLSYEQQMIVYLAFYENYTNQEIAEMLSKKANAIGVAKLRALKKLGKVLKDKGVDIDWS
jgi:RNA polymerase sigma-70 factor, ECF subfamily